MPIGFLEDSSRSMSRPLESLPKFTPVFVQFNEPIFGFIQN